MNPRTAQSLARVPCSAALALMLGLCAAPCALAKDKPRPAPSVTPAPCPSPTPTPAPRPPDAGAALALKYMRDSGEYVALVRMVYGFAAQAVHAALDAAPARDDAPPVVVLDIDETALDNSVYQLEREAFRLPFASDSWNAWARREQAGRVPGVAEFLASVRPRGVRVAWISDREASPETDLTDPTRRNLAAQGLWDEGDRLCLRRAGATKRDRREQTRRGQGDCGFGTPARVLAYVGDQLGDFPEDGEEGAGASRAAGFGRAQFLLPNPSYGRWSNSVTRPLP